MTTRAARIGIIGGGASGVVLAANLLRTLGPDTQILLIEKRPDIGRGLAYSTWDPQHLLNVRAGNMSAFADQPDHFHDWLQEHGPAQGIDAATKFCFVPRAVYGAYIGGLLHGEAQRLTVLHDECVRIGPTDQGVDLALAAGDVVNVDYAVLATGNEARPPFLPGCSQNPWQTGVLDQIAPHSPVMIIGTGLTMVDVVLGLDRRGHRGVITAVSRRGLLSNAHELVPAAKLARDLVPFGAPVSLLWRWVRALVRQTEAAGGNWRSVIDGLRPHTQGLWKAMDLDQRRRFLRHARPWWDVCRHRMAPEIAGLIQELIAAGRLRIRPARIIAAQRRDGSIVVTLRDRGSDVPDELAVAAVLDCTGLPDDPRQTSNPAIASLFAAALLRPGPLDIGFDLADDCALVGADGAVSQRLFAIGPLSRGMLWECIALPDIRNQCAELATRLATLVSPKLQ